MKFLLPFLFCFSAHAATLVTQTVGQVHDHVVTSREVQISMAIEGVLFPSAKAPAKSLNETRPGSPDFRSAVTAVLLEAVVALEAKNFNISTLTNEERVNAVAHVEKATAGRAYWNELEVSSAELKDFTERKLMAKSFLKFKTSSMAGIITDQEAQDYYERNRVKFGTSTFEGFKENIKTYLAQQQLEERIRSWFEVIKRKYRVRTFVAEP
jgi:hypothetical protein